MRPGHRAHWGFPLLAGVLIAAFLAQAFLASAVKSPVFDETGDIAAGLSYVQTGEIRGNLQHPPLLKEMTGAALWLAGVRLPDSPPVRQMLAGGGERAVGSELIARSGPDRTMFWARLPFLLLPVAALLLFLAVDYAKMNRSKADRRYASTALACIVMGAFATLVIQAVYLSPGGLFLYATGVQRVNADHNPDYLVCLGGRLAHHFAGYFAAAWLLKEPLAAILLCGAGLWALCGSPASRPVKWFLLLPPAVLFTAHTAFADNLGMRYLLPVLPFACLVSGAGAAWLIRRGTWGRAVTAALGLWLLAASAGVYPDHLSYFNEAACLLRNPSAISLDGGTRCGPLWLDDSNVDWGQSLKQVKDWVERNAQGERVRLAYFGSFPPRAYGLDAEPIAAEQLEQQPATGLYLVSAHFVARTQAAWPCTPTEIIGTRHVCTGSAESNTLTHVRYNLDRAAVWNMKTRLAILLLTGNLLNAQPGWWTTEPVRWVQTNLREVDAAMDTRRLVGQLADMRANVVLMGMGGISAYYPTRVEFHYPSPYLPAGRDMFGDVLREAHARGIRVVGRYDLSKTPKAAYDAHPEWFFRKADGNPVIYNGLYSTCINGGYYRGQAMQILSEGLERYDVDGLFFNMFGNQSTDYSGAYVGLCHCDSCRTRYRARSGREIPESADDEYRQFLLASSREVSEAIGKLIREKRPKAGYFNYMQEYTDGIMSESNTAVRRALPLWPYSAADNVNRALNSQPGKLPVDLNMQFVDFWWQFATVPRQEIALRMWQNLANGGALTFEVNGTLDLQDRQAYQTAKPIFQWAAANKQHYSAMSSAARVLLLGGSSSRGGDSYRGIFRLLTEEHIPFAVADNMEWQGKRPFDLVVATDWAPRGLQQYVEQGGRLLFAASRPPEFPIARVIATAPDVRGYVRVRNHSLFPSLADTDLLMLNGPFTSLEGDGSNSLSLVPPSMIGPPEKVHVDMRDTVTPAIVTKTLGQGTVAWLPWDLGALYYRHSLPAHAGLFRDLVGQLYPQRQLKTSAHLLVEVTLMQQAGRTQVHLVNLSGHSQTGYFPPVPMREIRIELLGDFKRARAVRHPMDLNLQKRGGYSVLVLPELADYELVVLN